MTVSVVVSPHHPAMMSMHLPPVMANHPAMLSYLIPVVPVLRPILTGKSRTR